MTTKYYHVRVPNSAIKFVRHFCCDDEHGAGNKIERSHAKVVRKSSREDMTYAQIRRYYGHLKRINEGITMQLMRDVGRPSFVM